MFFQAIIASLSIALLSLIGVLFFGNNRRLVGIQKYSIPVAVGVFLSLVLFELIPETVGFSPEFGGIVVAIGFITFYILAGFLHKKYHNHEDKDCDHRGAAVLLLIGDAVHNAADGILLGSAFLIDPTIGFVTAIGLALHEIPQEIVEFGVLIRAGYSQTKAALYNLLSASSILLGTLLILLISEHAVEYVWIFIGFAAGNLLFIATTDLLPRIHGDVDNYGGIVKSTLSVIMGFIIMTIILFLVHEKIGHELHHTHQDEESTENH